MYWGQASLYLVTTETTGTPESVAGKDGLTGFHGQRTHFPVSLPQNQPDSRGMQSGQQAHRQPREHPPLRREGCALQFSSSFPTGRDPRVPSWYLAVSAYCSVGLKHVILGLLGDELYLLKFTANF